MRYHAMPPFALLLLTGGTAWPDSPASQEIVITTRRDATPLAVSPVSASIVDGMDLDRLSLPDLAAADSFSPGLSIDSTAPISGSSNAAAIFLRGVGQSDFLLTQDPGVGLYLDDAYIVRGIGGVLDAVDIDRVEVLRGPQGTLYGRNTIGGLVRVVTRRPSGGRDGWLALVGGTDNRRDLSGATTIHAGETLAMRVAGAHREQEGHVTRLLSGDHLGGTNSDALRVRAVWSPAEALEIDTGLEGFRGRDDSPASAMASNNPAAIGAPETLFGGTYNATIGFHGGPPFDSRWLTGSPYSTNATGPNGSDTDVVGGRLGIRWRTGPGLALKSTTAYRHVNAEFGRDPDNSPGILIHNTNHMNDTSLSEDLALLGPEDSRLEWLVGLFALRERGSDRYTAEFIPETFGAPATDTPWEALGYTTVPPLVLGGPATRIQNDSLAVYADGAYHWTDRFSTAIGIRRTADHKEVDVPVELTQVGLRVIADPSASAHFADTSVRAALEYRWARAFTYLSYSQGYKSGGFNQRYGAPLPKPTEFAPEQLASWEVGVRANDSSGLLSAGLTVFDADYSDIQVVVFDGGIPRTINAARGEVTGVEAELAVIPSEATRLALTWSHLNARYTRLDPAIDGSFGQPVVNPLHLGYRFVDTPDDAVAATAECRLPFRMRGSLDFLAHWSYRSRWANDAVNTPELEQAATSILAASLSYTSADRAWVVSLIGTNLSDRAITESGVADKQGFGLTEVSVARPRELAVQVRRTWE